MGLRCGSFGMETAVEITGGISTERKHREIRQLGREKPRSKRYHQRGRRKSRSRERREKEQERERESEASSKSRQVGCEHLGAIYVNYHYLACYASFLF